MSDVRPASGARMSRRRRERPIVVCQECHRRKLKCNKQQPCDRCSKHSPPLKCTYAPDVDRRHRAPSERAHSHSVDEPDKAPSYISKAAHLGSPPITPAVFEHISKVLTQAGVTRPDGQFATFHNMKMDLIERRNAFAGAPEELNMSICEEIPERDITDLLVNRYFDTYGSVFLFLDETSFRADAEKYWEALESAAVATCIRILLVISVANGSLHDAHGRLPHSRVVAWWHLIQAWQSVALRSDPYGITTLQTCCLVIFMRHIYNLDATASLHSSNALVRNAMIASLHRDPALTDYLPSPEDLELRQHLWYTILELDLQSSMDDGIQPSLRAEDWDMPLPKEDIDPKQQHTDVEPGDPSTPRNILISSLPARVKIAHYLNGIKSSPRYDEALLLHAELKAVAYPLSFAFTSQDHAQNESFAHGWSALLTNRSFFALHLPFALLGSPPFAFSHNLCVATALSILNRLDPPESQETWSDEDPLVAMMRGSSAIFQMIAFPAILFVCSLLEGNLGSHQPWTLVSELTDRLVSVIESFFVIAEKRLPLQEYVARAYLIPAMVLARARKAGSGMGREEIAVGDEAIARELTARCFNIFRNRPDLPPK
ncbi:C6 zinc finger domain-containing protein [Colletotrichum plurivorum]|uniref:C6 zinc finger domain-containing protein n=1 Tax=Colletotrichum plurivorum TaxID=2175906 RepID=A0A8H6JIY2_9PEZI|nr:C6 zinc finger domain-containing protein [Colletotrichum plurivorum]